MAPESNKIPEPTWIIIYLIAELYALRVFPNKIKKTEVKADASHNKKRELPEQTPSFTSFCLKEETS